MNEFRFFLLILTLLLITTGCTKAPSSIIQPLINGDETDTDTNEEGSYLEPKESVANDLENKIAQKIANDLGALPDGQILEDEKHRLLLLTDPTDQYRHGILGDELEATSVTIVNSEDGSEISKFSVPSDWVIESIRPIWTDWDGDGGREILLTLSNDSAGAKLVLYNEAGKLLAESKPIGTGYRWRHALTIGGFGQEGEKYLVDVTTPHIGGIVNFYRWDKEEKALTRVASLSGYSTHDIGSKEMGMFALLENDKSGQITLVLPSQSKTEVAGLRLVDQEVMEVWRIPIESKIAGNMEIVRNEDAIFIRTVDNNGKEILVEVP